MAEFPKDIKIPYMDEEVHDILTKYVSFIEALHDTHQLLQTFDFNLSQFHDCCMVYYNDRIVWKGTKQSLSSIEINGFLINIISSGKTLVDAIETMLGAEVSKEFADQFKIDYISKAYDKEFSYRFLYYLRNFSQHGYLPVSQRCDGRFCFDLSQIMAVPHMNVSKSMQESMEKVRHDIVTQFNDMPYITFTNTVYTYTIVVLEIYYNYLKQIEDIVKTQQVNKNTVLEENPELVYHGEGILNNTVIYNMEETTLHFFYAESNLWNLFRDYRKQAKELLKKYKDEENNLSTLIVKSKNQNGGIANEQR